MRKETQDMFQGAESKLFQIEKALWFTYISFPFLKTGASGERKTSVKKKKGAAMDFTEFLLKIMSTL